MRLNTLLCQVSLPSPPNRTCQFPSIRLSSLPFALYIWLLHYVLLLYLSQSEDLLAFAMW